VTDRRGPDHLDLALDASEGRSTVTPGASDVEGTALRRLVDRGVASGRVVTFVTSAAGEVMSLPGLAGLVFTPTGRVSLTVEDDPKHWPAASETRQVELDAFRLTARSPLPWQAALGAGDFGVVLDGWHAPETLAGVRGRWTMGVATLAAPVLECGSASIEGAIRLASLRPAHVPQPAVAVVIAGEEVLRIVPPDSEFHVYALHLTDSVMHHLCGSPASIRISATPFVPQRDAGLRDDRTLGVAVSSLQLGAPSALPHE
jgi:hypothetical protein